MKYCVPLKFGCLSRQTGDGSGKCLNLSIERPEFSFGKKIIIDIA